ncbi:MAG: FAD-binding oxidoreductase [Patescibacteria group bacterium]|nr:FAD-binding oxidoreductase [Patescibacteria group bacterium]MDD5490422.1 FAD-binding oxidoreductase [Patescibacteria group bacterium]
MPDYKAKITKIEKLAPQVLSLYLQPQEKINFQAGQYILVKIPQHDIYRAYSLFSTPEENQIRLCIQLIPNGKASGYFAAIKEGEELEFKGPFGSFILEEAPEYIFAATGAGLSPLRCMIKELLQNGSKKPIHLFLGRRYEEDIFLTDELEELKKKYPNFSYTPTLTRPTSAWPGATGRVTEHLAKLKNYKNKKFYICGQPDMVNDCVAILKENGVETKDIHFEKFN